MPVTQADIQLALIRVKTKRAKDHIAHAEDAARKALKGISAFRDSKGGLHMPESTHTLPIEILSAAGDAIHNLRSALDHLAWQLAHWKGHKPTEHTGFPIGKSLANYKSMRARKVAGMCPEAKKAIDDLKPYRGGNQALWRIHYLDIADKHRQLYVLGYRYNYTGWEIPGILGTVTDQPAHFKGVFTDDLDSENKLTGQPAVREAEASDMQPLIPSLHELLVFTEDLIESFRPIFDLMFP